MQETPMSLYVFMKYLESAPHRYDRGIRILTFGRLEGAYDRLLSHLETGDRVLDIGCGTGMLTLKAARKGTQVKGIDINSRMLEIANERVAGANLERNVKLFEMGVAELDGENSGQYDAVTSGLCFSELTEDELLYTLRQIRRILKPGGVLLVADETRPRNRAKRILNGLIRFPVALLTRLIAGTATRALINLPERVEETGLTIESMRYNKMESFLELVGRKPPEVAK